jgi:hypothetical protein
MFDAYLVNKTKDPGAEVQVLDGNVKVPIDGWVPVTKKELEDTSIIFAVRRGWVEVVMEEPKTPKAPFIPVETKLRDPAKAEASETTSMEIKDDLTVKKEKKRTDNTGIATATTKA